ncbi:MAG: hypothetical protein EBS01_13110, partial [Verrucomicrobia bacterium]|nr:hypothetical protein [Verrucomicrobiota bacterium]
MLCPLRFLLSGLCLLSFSLTHGAVVRVEVFERSDIPKTDYEQIVGRLHFEIDPRVPGNAIIADVDLAPINPSGKVAFSSDLRLLRPKEPARSNAAAWVEIPNRGGKATLSAAMMAQGFTLLNVGWEFDVPKGQDKLRISVPVARNADGSAIRGIVNAVFTPEKRAEEQAVPMLATYPPVDIDGPDSRLVIRRDAAFPAGLALPRSSWSVAEGRLKLEGGFEPGKTYELFYLAEGPPLAGLGYAAIRDAVAWLKHGADSLAPVKHAYAFGASQCGRFLRDFLYLGFNTDELNHQALDGVMSHVAGAGRLVLNQRWSSPREVWPYYTASYPFADSVQIDPVSKHSDAVLDNPRVRHRPKVFYTNTASEYWGAGRVAALTHTNVESTEDIPLPDDVRSYFFSGTAHGPAPFPPTSQVKDSPLGNPVSASASMNALRFAMHRWVTEGIAPPSSVYPKLAEGTLVPAAEVAFPKVPGMAAPNAVNAGGRVRNPLWADGAAAGAALPLFVPQVDA